MTFKWAKEGFVWRYFWSPTKIFVSSSCCKNYTFPLVIFHNVCVNCYSFFSKIFMKRSVLNVMFNIIIFFNCSTIFSISSIEHTGICGGDILKICAFFFFLIRKCIYSLRKWSKRKNLREGKGQLKRSSENGCKKKEKR